MSPSPPPVADVVVAAADEEEKQDVPTPPPPVADVTLPVFSPATTPQPPPRSTTAPPSSSSSSSSSMDLESCLLFIRNLQLSPKTKALPLERDLLTLRRLLANSSTRVRGAALRALRFVAQIPNQQGVVQLNTHRIHLLACRCLEREKFLEERVQALKLFRAIAQHAPDRMPRTLLRSVVAIASHRDDALKEPCLESLRELALTNTKLVAECNGIAALAAAVVDPSMAHLADSLLLTILHLLGQHSTRIWLRPSLDLAILLAPFTSTGVEGEGDDATAAELQRQRRKLSQRAIVTMMRTWTGLLILSSDPQGLRSLVQMLVQPVSLELRKDVLDTILLVFHTVNPLRSKAYGSAHNDASATARGERATSDSSFRGGSFDLYDDGGVPPIPPPGEGAGGMGGVGAGDATGMYGSEPFLAEYWGVGPGSGGSKELSSGGFHTERVPGRHVHTHNLMDNFLAMILLAFVQCGLVEALVELAVSSSEPVNRAATQLLSFVTRFSTRLLPKEVSRRLLSQKKLVASAVDAARAGQVVDRARAQRAAHVIGLLSRIVGSGYDTALATLLARSTYEDAIALASEFALSNERIHLNSGVFPKTQVVSKRTVAELLTAQQPRHMQAMQQQQQQQMFNAAGGGASRGGGGVTVMGNLKKLGRRFTLTNSSPSSSTAAATAAEATGFSSAGEEAAAAAAGRVLVPELDGGRPNNQAQQHHHQVDAAVGRTHHPLVANRGHRRLVLQLVLTDSSSSATNSSTTAASSTSKSSNVGSSANNSSNNGGGTVDLAEVKRVLDKCRIMLKPERRNWKSWDWVAIDEAINGPCQNPLVLSEVLKTKFFKRLSAFYAVAGGPFSQMRWDADCLGYTAVCVSMCKLLLSNYHVSRPRTAAQGGQQSSSSSHNVDEELVRDILCVDRRGRLVAQITDSLHIELSHAMGEDLHPSTSAAAATTPGVSALDPLGVASSAAAASGDLLRPSAIIFSHHHPGYFGGGGGGHGNTLNAVDEDDLGGGGGEEDDFDQTQQTHRVFTAQACTTTMAREFFVLLGVFAASKTGLHLLDELNVFNTLTKLSLHREKDYLLRLAISNFDYLGPVDRPREWLQLVLMNSKISLDLRAFCLGVFRSLVRANLTRPIAEWLMNMIFAQLQTSEVRATAVSVLVEACHYPIYLDIIGDLAFSTSLSVPFHYDTDRELVLKLLARESGVQHMKRLGWLSALFAQWKHPGYVAYLEQIDRALLAQLYDASSSSSSQQQLMRAIPVRSHESDALSEPGFASSDLQFLFKLPWKIEVCCDSTLGTVKVAMDCFIDLSHYRPNEGDASRGGDEASSPRGICITAVPPWSRDSKDGGDKRQRARPFIVPEDATLYASLALGSAPVDRRGRVHAAPATGGTGFQFTFPRGDGNAQQQQSPLKTAQQQHKIRHKASKQFGAGAGGGGGYYAANFTGRGSVAYSVDHAPTTATFAGGLGGTMEDEMFDRPFAEASHDGGGGVDLAASLSDERFWSRCQPQDRKWALKQAHDNYAGAPAKHANPVMPGASFPFCPSHGPALFKFSTLEAQHRDSFLSSASAAPLDVPAHHVSSGTFAPVAAQPEPEVKYVNPLMALRGGNAATAAASSAGDALPPRSPRNKAASHSSRYDAASHPRLTTSSGGSSTNSHHHHHHHHAGAAANNNESDLPPLLVLKEVRFYLELVPERSATSSIPVHLLGELAKTPLGVEEISQQNLLKYFVGKIKDVHEANVERRAALWALGQIGGASELAFERLHACEPSICRMISQVAMEASCLSLRGAACYTLGLFSRHAMGSSQLNKIGWATLDARSHPFASIAVPHSVGTAATGGEGHGGHGFTIATPGSFFHLPGGRATHLDVTAALTCSVDGVPTTGAGGLADATSRLSSPESRKVYALISDLSNHIAQKDAHGELSKIKDATPLVFADVRLYLAVHDLLARFNYELAVRQYVLGLFHVKISFESEHTWQQIDREPLH